MKLKRVHAQLFHLVSIFILGLYVNEILVVVLLVNFFSVYLAITSQPEKIISTGFHEPVGSCNETEPLYTPIGLVRIQSFFF